MTISHAFEMLATEVTVDQFRASRRRPPDQPDWNTKGRQPVVNVTWDEARAFYSSVGGRLPTEAEWEYAARGGRSGLRYPWGNEISHDELRHGHMLCGVDQRARRWAQTAPVESFDPNGYGLYDMAGNVWEWPADWYDAAYYRSSPATDPFGPAHGRSRVVRGGGWYNFPRYLRVSGRNWDRPDDRCDYGGFRCARDVSP